MQVNAPSRLKRAAETGRSARLRANFEEISWDEALDPRNRAGWNRSAKKTRLKSSPSLLDGTSPRVFHQLLGAEFRNAELCRPWRLLFGEHGRRRHLHDRWELSGNSVSRTGTSTKLFHALRRRGRPRFSNPIKMGLGKLKARGGKRHRHQPDPLPATMPLPMNGSGSRPGTDGLFILSPGACAS